MIHALLAATEFGRPFRPRPLFLAHRAEALCFVRAAFQAERSLRNDGRFRDDTRPSVLITPHAHHGIDEAIEAPGCGSGRYADSAPRFRYALPRGAFHAIGVESPASMPLALRDGSGNASAWCIPHPDDALARGAFATKESAVARGIPSTSHEPRAHSPIHPFTHSPIHPFTHSPIHPFTHSRCLHCAVDVSQSLGCHSLSCELAGGHDIR